MKKHKTKTPTEEENERLFDLVRYQRHELHQSGLISDEEFANLLEEGGKYKAGSVRRLETYDDMRRTIAELKKELREKNDRNTK